MSTFNSKAKKFKHKPPKKLKKSAVKEESLQLQIPKGHIFSAKTRARHKRMLDPKYFEENILPKIFDHDSISELSNPEVESLKNYIRVRKKEIRTILSSEEVSADLFSMGTQLTGRRNSASPSKIMEEFMRQQMFFQELNTERQFRNPNSHPDNDYNYDDVKEVMKNEDKWRLLRKLAEIDPRLNVDRGWASETLHAIERYIEMNQYSYEEIEEMMVESFTRLVEENKKWDSNLHGWYSETGEFIYAGDDIGFGINDILNEQFTASQGFHGRKKAEQRWYNQYKKYAKDIDNFEPIWDDPSKFSDFTV